MPVPGSKRGARASPLSTTTRTPSTVSDVSAMSVASTTRRRPGGDGARARSCSSSASAPARRWTSTPGPRSPIELVGEPGDLADAGQERQHVAVLVAQRPPDRRSPSRPPAGRRDERGTQRTSTGNVRPTLSTTGAGPASRRQQAGEQRGVGGRRHRRDAQVRAQRRRGVERERQPEVGRQVALVDLVEDDEPDAGQLGVLLQAARQHALGQHLDPRRRADAALVAGLVADEVADARAR